MPDWIKEVSTAWFPLKTSLPVIAIIAKQSSPGLEYTMVPTRNEKRYSFADR
jgi:hypothetical protein